MQELSFFVFVMTLNAFYWYQLFALDSVVVKAQNCLARKKAS